MRYPMSDRVCAYAIDRCGGLRACFDVFYFGCRYAELKVKMATMEAEKDGEADLKDEWQ